MYFLYQHIRLDTNQPFYIGVGTKDLNSNFHKSIYKRAYSKDRNFFWHRIVNKTKYSVNIISEFEDLIDCLKEETRLIDLYGRLIDQSGILANIARDNYEIEQKRLLNLRASIEKRKIKVYKYSKDGQFIGEYESITEAAKKNNTLPSDISLAIKGKRCLIAGFQWKDFYTDNIGVFSDNYETTPIYQYDLEGNFVRKWKSINIASEELKVCTSAIRNCLCGLSKSSSGYIWDYNERENVNSRIKKDKLIVYDKEKNFIGSYKTLSQAEKELNLPKNSISVYLRRSKPHPKYVFDKKTKEENDERKR